jgi:hypothetical protein
MNELTINERNYNRDFIDVPLLDLPRRKLLGVTKRARDEKALKSSFKRRKANVYLTKKARKKPWLRKGYVSRFRRAGWSKKAFRNTLAEEFDF